MPRSHTVCLRGDHDYVPPHTGYRGFEVHNQVLFISKSTLPPPVYRCKLKENVGRTLETLSFFTVIQLPLRSPESEAVPSSMSVCPTGGHQGSTGLNSYVGHLKSLWGL